MPENWYEGGRFNQASQERLAMWCVVRADWLLWEREIAAQDSWDSYFNES